MICAEAALAACVKTQLPVDGMKNAAEEAAAALAAPARGALRQHNFKFSCQ